MFNCSGSTYTDFTKVMEEANVQWMSKTLFYDYQHSHILPVIKSQLESCLADAIEKVKQGGTVLQGNQLPIREKYQLNINSTLIFLLCQSGQTRLKLIFTTKRDLFTHSTKHRDKITLVNYGFRTLQINLWKWSISAFLATYIMDIAFDESFQAMKYDQLVMEGMIVQGSVLDTVHIL